MNKRLQNASFTPFVLDSSLGATRLAAVGALAGILLLTGCEMGPKRPPLEATRLDINVPMDELQQPYAKAFGDMNADGNPDIIIGELGGSIFCYSYPGWERCTLSPGNGGDDLAVADIDGDGKDDIVSNGQSVSWYQNDGQGKGNFKEFGILHGRRTHDLVAADVNKDGKMDIVTRDEKNNLSFLLIQESALAYKWTEVKLVNALGGVGTAIADMNGDGKMDILGSGYYLQQGADASQPGDWTRVEITPWPAPSSVQAHDMDKDGRMDMVIAAAYENFKLSWYRNPGDGSEWKETKIADLSHVHRFHIADVDGNGGADVIFAEQHQSKHHRVGVMLNNDGAGSSWTMKLFDDRGGHNIAVADVGKDGNLEVLAVNWQGDTKIRLLTNLLKETKTQSPGPRLLSNGKLAPAQRPATMAGSLPIGLER